MKVLPYPVYNAGWRFFDLRRYGRDHRKILVVDDAVGFVGGYNIGTAYATEWRDTHVRVTGPGGVGPQACVRRLLEPQPPPADRPQRAAAAARDGVRRGSRGSGSTATCRGCGCSRSAAMYLEAINRASRNIWLTQAYFLPDQDFVDALVDAAQRGVDVRLLVPLKSNHIVADWISRGYYAQLLAAGVRIFRFQGAMVHAKTATVDGIVVDRRHRQHRPAQPAGQLRDQRRGHRRRARRDAGGDLPHRPGQLPRADPRRVGGARPAPEVHRDFLLRCARCCERACDRGRRHAPVAAPGAGVPLLLHRAGRQSPRARRWPASRWRSPCSTSTTPRPRSGGSSPPRASRWSSSCCWAGRSPTGSRAPWCCVAATSSRASSRRSRPPSSSAAVAEIWHLVVLQAIAGTVFAVSYPAFLGMVPILLPVEERKSAFLLIGQATAWCGILGPAVSGVAGRHGRARLGAGGRRDDLSSSPRPASCWSACPPGDRSQAQGERRSATSSSGWSFARQLGWVIPAASLRTGVQRAASAARINVLGPVIADDTIGSEGWGLAGVRRRRWACSSPPSSSPRSTS